MLLFRVSLSLFFFASRRRHTRCALVTGVQTCALPISPNSPKLLASLIRRLSRCFSWAGDLPSKTARLASIVASRARARDKPEGPYFPSVSVSRRPCSRRSEEHTSELQSLMRISYAVFCLKKKTQKLTDTNVNHQYV